MPCAVILTAIRAEYMAVRAYLKKPKERVHRGTVYEKGRFSANKRVWDIGIAEIGAGNPGAAAEAERAIAYFQPQVILFVGVAGGIKDVQLGDVVASTKVYAYESGKAEETFKPRPEIGLSAYGLEQRARFEARNKDWLKRLRSTPETTPTVFVAPIAAGEKVIASTQSEVFQFLRSNYGDAVAVEMEGIGFLNATHANQQVSAMVIRGISDLIDGKSEVDAKGYQEIAASHASAFAFQILAKFDVGNDKVDSIPSVANTKSVNSKELSNYQQTVRPEAERDLLKEVKRQVNCRLDGQLHHRVRLNLSKETQPRQVRPWDMDVKVALPQQSQLLSPETSIGQVFDQCSGRLLILGEPGAGKTTSLLDLALELAAIAEADPQQRIPVVVDLADWQPIVSPSTSRGSRVSRKNFSEPFSEEELVESTTNWLISKVSNKYGVVSLQQIQQWLEKKRLVPLLDGLDEVSPEYQRDCVRAINLWLDSKWQPTEVAVCCRREPYESYSEKLKLYGAVYLQDLTDKQIQKFLVEANRGELAKSLMADENLLALIRRPLLLSMAIIAYKELEQIQWQRATSAGDRLNLLLDAYVRYMLNQDRSTYVYSNKKLPSQEQSRKWLEILALQLLQDSETDFLVERINTRWLSTFFQKRLFTVLAIAAWGLIIAIGSWLLVPLVVRFTVHSIPLAVPFIVHPAPFFTHIIVAIKLCIVWILWLLPIVLILWVWSEWENIYINRLLVRLCLLGTKSIPWNYTRFLNYAKDRLLLQRTGNSYRFIHNLLRQFLAKSRINSDPDLIRPQVFFRCGISCASRKQYNEALQQFNYAIVFDPKYYQAITERGITYRLMERYEEALQDFNRSIVLNPKSYQAITERGITYRLMERYEEALQDFNRSIVLIIEELAYEGISTDRLMRCCEEVIKPYEEVLQNFKRSIILNPKFYLVLARRGITDRLMKSHEEFFQDLNRALGLNSRLDWVIAQIGIGYGFMECPGMKSHEEILQDLNRAIGLNSKLDWIIAQFSKIYRLTKRYEEVLLEPSIVINPRLDWVIAQRGVTYKRMEHYEEALQDFNRSIVLNPKYNWAIAERGKTYKLMESYEEALQDFNLALVLNPRLDWVIANRGRTYRLMKQYEEALQDLNLALVLNPRLDWAITERGKTYRLMKQYEEALQDLNHAIELNPRLDWVIAERGKTYRLMKQYEGTLQDLNHAIELNPRLDWAITERGKTYRLMEHYEEALRDLNRALVLNPRLDWAIANRGRTYRLMEHYEEALRDLNRALVLNPRLDWAIAERGKTYILMGRYKKALQDFNHAIELNPRLDWAITERGKTYRLMGRYKKALQDFSRALEIDPRPDLVIERGVTYRLMGRYKEALQDFSHAIELNPKDGWAIAQRGTTYRLMERYKKALQDFSRALEIDLRLDRVIERGVTYRLMGRYKEALQDFSHAIELNPKDGWASAGFVRERGKTYRLTEYGQKALQYGWAITERGITYRLMERYEEALQDFNRALKNFQGNRALTERGITYRLMERYKEALQNFNNVIKFYPKSFEALTERGITYRLMERYKEALQDFNHAIKLNPKSFEALTERGIIYSLMEHYEEALQDFNHAIKLNPKSFEALTERGIIYSLMERDKEALQDFNRAIELEPRDDWAIAQRGATYRLMERYEEALQDFNRAIELEPRDDWAIAQRGATYRLMERYEEALQDFNRAIELEPGDDWHLYLRGCTYLILHQADNAKADLNNAIKIAKDQQSKEPDDCQNTFDLALYHLVAGNPPKAQQLYQAALQQGASQIDIRDAIQNLTDLLQVFPENTTAEQIKAILVEVIS
ncbi:MAG: tetratricopeptide repeat protein [Symploca sp. SIO3E6]|nr:tetratricopeptide repeat protein [Caldora sp. SIO3E6]